MQDRDMLQGRQRKELHEALLDAFTYATFERMLSYELDKMLENIVPPGYARVLWSFPKAF